MLAAKFLNKANTVKVAAAFIDGVHDGTGRSKRGTIETTWVPGTAGDTTSLVEVSISCRNLADKDLLSKSDPMCVVFHRPPGSKTWVQLMRTEVIFNDLNPDFVEKVTMEYRFEQVQALRFEVYDIDSQAQKLSSQDSIGMVECTLGQIVSAGEEGLKMELNSLKSSFLDSARSPGTIIFIAEEVSSEKDEVTLKVGGNAIGSWSCCIPPKSYFAISKVNDAGIYLIVYRSKPSRGSNPNWPQFSISSRLLCNGDLQRELKIDVVQRKISGLLSRIGFTLTTLGKMLRQDPQEKISLVTHSGDPCRSSIRIMSCAIHPIHTFLDYVQGGTQIQCCFSIDFTCSNGDPTDPESLHYVSNAGNQPNPYEQAIQAVGNIVKDYDNTNLFPTYGFGARIPPKGAISHDFSVTLTPSPNCCSIPGVLEAYRNCIGKIQLFGPTNFAPVINLVADLASKTKGGECYYILVIVTDGVISDMVKTKKAIVDASIHPLSIIIIGVGEAEFDAMQELDGDAVRLSHKGKQAQRDIVQFVSYRSARSWMANTGENTMSEHVMHDILTAVQGAPPVDGSTMNVGVVSAADVAGSTVNIQASSANLQGSTAALRESSDVKVKVPSPVKVIAPVVVVAATDPSGGEDKEDKTNRLAQGQLAQEVLMEIPEQITGYMKSRGILPNMIKANQAEADKEKAKEAAKKAAAVVPTDQPILTATQVTAAAAPSNAEASVMGSKATIEGSMLTISEQPME